MKKTHIYRLALLLAGLLQTANAAIIDVNLTGTTDNDTWANINNTTYAGYNNQAWANPAASNVGGDAYFTKSGTTVASMNAYGMQGAGGKMTITDLTPVSGLKTIVLQFDYLAIGSAGEDYNGPDSLAPTLKFGTTTIGQADYVEYEIWDATHPQFGYGIESGTFSYQWNLTDDIFSTASGFSIEWTHPGVPGALLTNLYLDQGTVFTQVVNASQVPEPSAFAALAGLGALGFATLRRKRRS